MPPQLAVGLGSQFLGQIAGGLFKKQSNPYQAQLSQQRMYNQNYQNQQNQLGQQNQSTANRFSGMYSRGLQNEMERLNNPDATNNMLRQAGAQMGNITANAAQAQGRYNAMGNALNMGNGMTNTMMTDNFWNNPISTALSQGAVQYAMGADARRQQALGLAGQGYGTYQGAANTAFGNAQNAGNNLYGQYQAEAQAEMQRDAALQNQRDQIAGMFGQLGGSYLSGMSADRDFKQRQGLIDAQINRLNNPIFPSGNYPTG
jgi:hypothetical protein